MSLEENNNSKDQRHIQLKIMAAVADHEYEVCYQVKRYTPLVKLKKTYAKRVGLPLQSLIFHLNGDKIPDNSTCQSLNINNGDTILVSTRFVSRQFTPKFHFPAYEFNTNFKGRKGEKVKLQIVDQHHTVLTTYKVKSNYRMRELRKWYGKYMDLPAKQISFVYDNKTVQDHDTPASLKYKEGDVLMAKVTTKEHIRIRLVSQPDKFYEFFVNVEMSSTIAQLKSLYGQRVDTMPRHLVFKHQDCDLENESTIQSLNLTNGDVIQVYCRMPIRIGSESKTIYILYVLKCLTFHEIKNRVCKSLAKYKLLYKDKEVMDTDSPGSLDMDYDDKLIWVRNCSGQDSTVAS